MIFKDFNFSGDNLAVIEYETTWALGWSNVLDIAQIFLDDIVDEVQLIQYIDFGEGVDIERVTDGVLEKTKELIKEHMGISLAGASKVMELPIRLTLFNQLKRVNVQVMLLTDEMRGQFKYSPHTLDVYMNSLEISGYMRRAEKNGIEIVHDAMVGRSEQVERYMIACNDLNIEPKRSLI